MSDASTAPLAVNFHVWKPCNMRCRYCFSVFRGVEGHLCAGDALQVITLLARAGTRKITFVGGEPTLCPHLGALLARARRLGLVTCVVTNGARLPQLLSTHAASIDWVGLSIDSADEGVQAALGRGSGDHVRRSVRLLAEARRLGLKTKLNTVVTELNHTENLAPLVRLVRPDRWKVFQVLPVSGENDAGVRDLLIDRKRFDAFVARHASLRCEGLGPIAEDNDAMRGSYVMVDPCGRFFGNSDGRLVYSRPILEAGVVAALAETGFEPRRLAARGGVYRW